MTSPFSVLLPVYHRDDPVHLARSFASVTTGQDLIPAEVVIVRDGPIGPRLARLLESCVETAAVPVTVVPLERNRGLAYALHAGLEACSYEIVARQDADDISRPQRFAIQVPLVDQGLDIVGSAIQEFETDAEIDSPSDLGMVRRPPLTAEEIAHAIHFRSPFNHPSVVYRKSAVLAAGGYQDLPQMEDYWLFARMIGAGARAANVREPLVLYRVGAGAYARRGGMRLLRSELELQRRMHQRGLTSKTEYVRNAVLRGGYRLVPESLRRRAYRADAMRRHEP